MVTYIKKDITTVEAGIVGHGVNCQGRMGSGVALAIKNKWPEVYKKYMTLSPKLAPLGKVQFVSISDDLHIANMFTQDNYGYDGARYASVDAIRMSMNRVCFTASLMNMDVYIPKIGSGLGGLDWDIEVAPVIEQVAEEQNVNVFVCEI